MGVEDCFSDHLSDKIRTCNFVGCNFSIFGTLKNFYKTCSILPATPGHFKKSKYPIFWQKIVHFGVRIGFFLLLAILVMRYKHINFQGTTLVYLGWLKFFIGLAGSFRPLPATSKNQNIKEKKTKISWNFLCT